MPGPPPPPQEDDRIFPGASFGGVDDAKEVVKEFNKKHFVDFVVAANNKKTLRFVCKHGCAQRKRTKGLRKTQHYNAQNCGAFVNFYKTKNEGIKCTQFINTHNHPVSEEIYNHEHVILNAWIRQVSDSPIA